MGVYEYKKEQRHGQANIVSENQHVLVEGRENRTGPHWSQREGQCRRSTTAHHRPGARNRAEVRQSGVLTDFPKLAAGSVEQAGLAVRTSEVSKQFRRAWQCTSKRGYAMGTMLGHIKGPITTEEYLAPYRMIANGWEPG